MNSTVSPRHCTRATKLLAKKRRRGGDRWQYCIQFDQPGIWTSDLLLRDERVTARPTGRSEMKLTLKAISRWPWQSLAMTEIYCSKSVLLKKWELLEVIKRCSKPFFHNFLYSQKYDLIRLTPYHWQPCISQFCDITKAWFCKISRRF